MFFLRASCRTILMMITMMIAGVRRHQLAVRGEKKVSIEASWARGLYRMA